MRRFLSWLRLTKAASRPPGPKPPELMTDSDWVRHRAPRRWRDDELSADARKWLERLPEDSHPHALAERFPRLANRLALLWRDPGLTEHFLIELLQPARPGRQGFAPDVLANLQTLLVLNDHRLYRADEPDGPTH